MLRSLLLMLFPLAALALASPGPSFFPVSVWYAGGKARAPMLEPVTAKSAAAWRKDLAQIKSLGFNTVRTWVEWGACEPRPGQYRLDQLDLMLKLAQEARLRVIVQVYMDSAPDWVGQKFPEGRFVAQNGQAIPSQSAPGYCFDHPGVRKAMLDFLKEVARHAAKSPAFYAWDLWSEPHIINWAEINYIPNATFCYCDSTIARFRGWLKAKYHTLAALNKAWYRQFQTWKEPEPPRFDTILSYADYMDWRVFVTQKLAEDLKSRDRAVREIMPNCITTSHAAVPSVFGSFAEGDGNPDDYLMFKSVDYYGTSIYPKHSLPPHWSPERVMFGMDLTRSAGSNHGFYIGELQGGFGVRGDVISQEITPADLTRYMWTAVSRGARGINIYAYYPMSSGYESGGYGLINLDGTLTERSKAAGRAAREIAANAELLLAARPRPAQVAVVVNQLTNLIGGSGHVYNAGAVTRSASAYHRIFQEQNVSVDFLSAPLVSLNRLRAYKLVVVPYPMMMLSAEAAALERYVHEGGRLFVEARPGWVDERGFAQETVPGFGWTKMLGVRELSSTPMPSTSIRWGSDQIPGAMLEERFSVEDSSAVPLAFYSDGSPAAYAHAYGKGEAIIVGSFVGQAYESPEAQPRRQSNIVQGSLSEPALAAHPLGSILCAWARVDRPALKSSLPVDFQELDAPSGRFLFFMNWNASPAEIDFSESLAHRVKRIAEITSGQVVPVDGDRLRLQTEIPPGGVLVYRVDDE